VKPPSQVAGYQIGRNGCQHQNHYGYKTPIAMGTCPKRGSDFTGLSLLISRVLIHGYGFTLKLKMNGLFSVDFMV